jgi:hypothetical protein
MVGVSGNAFLRDFPLDDASEACIQHLALEIWCPSF